MEIKIFILLCRLNKAHLVVFVITIFLASFGNKMNDTMSLNDNQIENIIDKDRIPT